jgi:predicted GNAT family acetyltransferase
MELLPLGPALEPKFWEHVNQDIPHYFHFALDWKHRRSDTKILLALKDNHIDGMLLIFKERNVQLRGSRESAEALLERLVLEKADLQVSEQLKKPVLEKYQPTSSHELLLMILRKGEESLHITHPLIPLDASDAEAIATMMTGLNPEFWGEITRERIVEGMNKMNWVGIKEKGELISIGGARLTERVGHIPTVAAHESHRNKGYATSITSYLLRTILEKTPIAIIYTLSDNTPAITAYKKVGFKPYREYFFMRGVRR